MECKNCNYFLRTDYSYCPTCGAKVIRNRLTVKNIWYDFTERFFNLDNTFIITFKHLLTKPDVVIGGYINGVRKKYMNPISYFTIAVFLGGIFFFLNKKFFPEAMDFQSIFIPNVGTKEAQQFNLEFMKKYQDFAQEYQSFIYMASIPILAIISRLVFLNKKQFNLSEHFVINIYAYAQMSITVNIIYILSIWNSKLIFLEASLNMFFLVGYFSFVYKKLFQLSWKQILLKLLLFVFIVLVLYIVIVIMAIIIVIIYMALFTDKFTKVDEVSQVMALF